jgi:NitT/TauT family transport system substrate-binding protein
MNGLEREARVVRPGERRRCPVTEEETMRALRLNCIVLFAAALLTAPAAVSAEPVKIRAGWVGAPASIIPFMFLKEGLAKHNGKSYRFEPAYFAGSPLQITAIAAGELEVATLGYSTFSSAVLNAGMKDLRIVADEIADGVGNNFSLTYAVRKDSGIQKVQDLKDKVVATNAIGAGAYIPLDVMLRRNQLLPNRDYRIVETQFPNMKAMLMESKVALITSTTPFYYDPELQGIMQPLFRAKDAMGVTALSFWVMRAGFVEKNRAVVLDLLEDYIRATRWFIDPANRTEAVEIISRFTKIPAERIASFVFTERDFYRSPDVLPDFGALQKNVDAQKEIGLIKGDLKISDHAEPGLVREAAQRIR